MAPKTAPAYCRLFLATPLGFNLSELQELLAGAIAGGDIASLLIRQDNQQREIAMAITKVTQDAGIAVLIENDLEIALACKADGVEIGGVETDGIMVTYTAAREMLGLGDDMVVGVACGANRHGAMSAGEAGADYVTFDSKDEARWWAKVFEIPCVFSTPLALADAAAVVRDKVDFIIPAETMWDSAAGAGETVQKFNQMIGEIQIETI